MHRVGITTAIVLARSAVIARAEDVMWQEAGFLPVPVDDNIQGAVREAPDRAWAFAMALR